MPMYPRDRLLAFLAKIANEPGPDLEPRDWLEYYLDKIAENGGGGCECNLTTLNLDTVPEYTVTVEDVEYSSQRDVLHIVLDDTITVDAGHWFVYAAPNPPFLLYETNFYETNFIGAGQYVPNPVATIEDFQAQSTGLSAGLYLDSADVLVICETSNGVYVFLTNPTFSTEVN